MESREGFSAGLQWEMIRDYFRMKINDKVQTVWEGEGGAAGGGGAEEDGAGTNVRWVYCATQGQRQELHLTNSLYRSGNYLVPYIADLYKLMTWVINRQGCIY